MRSSTTNSLFIIHYQPIVNLSTGLVDKAEALVRWQHPERGLISPLDFIGLAEETGLIIPLGEWVISQALTQAAQWQLRAGYPFKISVNTSPVQFNNNNKRCNRWFEILTDPQLIPIPIINWSFLTVKTNDNRVIYFLCRMTTDVNKCLVLIRFPSLINWPLI